jgi:DNA-binding NtrC family response regulator
LLLQSKLVRVIKEGELRRHGEEMARTVDVRLVLSTHTELSQLVAEGVFRKDLHVALRDSMLKVPPLRERQDDLLPLLQIFLGVFCRRFALPVPRIGESVEEKLRGHNWPGNVRELQGAVESAVLKHRDGVLTAEDFGF